MKRLIRASWAALTGGASFERWYAALPEQQRQVTEGLLKAMDPTPFAAGEWVRWNGIELWPNPTQFWSDFFQGCRYVLLGVAVPSYVKPSETVGFRFGMMYARAHVRSNANHPGDATGTA